MVTDINVKYSLYSAYIRKQTLSISESVKE